MYKELITILNGIQPGTVTDRPLMDWYRRHKNFFDEKHVAIFDSDLQDRHFGFLLRRWDKDNFKEIEHYYYTSYLGNGWYNSNGETSYSGKDIDRLIAEIKELTGHEG